MAVAATDSYAISGGWWPQSTALRRLVTPSVRSNFTWTLIVLAETQNRGDLGVAPHVEFGEYRELMGGVHGLATGEGDPLVALPRMTVGTVESRHDDASPSGLSGTEVTA